MEHKYQIIVLKPINSDERKSSHKNDMNKEKSDLIKKIAKNMKQYRKDSFSEPKGEIQNAPLRKKIKVLRMKKVKLPSTNQESQTKPNILEDYKNSQKSKPTWSFMKERRSRNVRELVKSSNEDQGRSQKLPLLRKGSTFNVKSQDENFKPNLPNKRGRNMSRSKLASLSSFHIKKKTELIEKAFKAANQTPVYKSRNSSVGPIKSLIAQTSQAVENYKKLLFEKSKRRVGFRSKGSFNARNFKYF
ncbi:unnamed protein product [Moneuplotes crassus]|uniref:Uncharacterized protein n=1 Tax=Euplotes crassus TaxID=5936 RepID=A0AAD1ULF1_EUPCR|nr:unnamed protein product [Moneuplotes crassus]